MLYSGAGNLSIYYKVGKLGKMIQNNIRKTQDWTSSEKNDVLFYVIYGVVAKLLNQTNITTNDMVNFDLTLVTETFIDDVKKLIYQKYKDLGGDSRITKSSDFIGHIDTLLGLK